VYVSGAPPGHNKPIFELPNFKGSVEVREKGDFPTPYDFYSSYASGWGKPFIMRGAVKDTPAFEKWQTDADLLRHYPRAVLSQIEFAKKETREADGTSWPLSKFLKRYNNTDAYAVSKVPAEMAADLPLPELLKCGYASRYLDVNNMWLSSGGTKSVIHNDDQDNINCVFTGTKRFFMVDARNKTHVEHEKLGWMIAEEIRAENPDYQGYGAYGGGVDVDKMDLEKHPRWADVPWYDASLEAGDCLFIPTSWYHHVLSPAGERSLAVNLWWWRRDGPFHKEIMNDCPARDHKVTFADCKFGYEGPPDSPRAPVNTRALTGCKGIKIDEKPVDAHSFITRWQRFPERRLFAALQEKGIDEFTAPISTQVQIMEGFHRATRVRSALNPPAQGQDQDEEDDGDGDEL